MLTMRMVDSRFLAFCHHLGEMCMLDKQPTILKSTMCVCLTFHARDIALFLDFKFWKFQRLMRCENVEIHFYASEIGQVVAQI